MMQNMISYLDNELRIYFEALISKNFEESPDIQRLLDAYRKAFDVDTVYILKNDSQNSSFVYTHTSASAPEYDLKGERVPVTALNYQKLRSIYDADGLCTANRGNYKAGSLKSIIHYAAIYTNEITGLVGMLDFHRERVWTKTERQYALRLGRVLSNHIIKERLQDLNKAYQETAEKAKMASEAKTRFLFNMSHDIRTPMNAVIGYTQMAKRHLADTERAAGYLDKISNAGHELLALINQVLEMSRIEAGTITLAEKQTSIQEELVAMLDVMNVSAANAGIPIETRLKRLENNDVITDPDSVSQVFLNILSNAIKYSKPGGKVIFTVDEQPGDAPGISNYTFTIEDEGIGMSKEFLEHIFEEFARENHSTVNKIQGTGLGMSIVKRLVDLLGGKIEIESELDVGTTITVTLPMKTTTEAREDTGETILFTDTDKLKNKRVLLVEDNEMNLEIAEELLSTYGLIVETARDGDIAVDMVNEAVDRKDYEYYDLILMDIQMPRMSGYEATRKIRAISAPPQYHIPIIAMTANAFEEDRQAAFAAGMEDHIAKPIDINHLIRTISRFVQ